MTKKELLQTLLSQQEHECLEFKKAENDYDFRKICKYFSALSNEANLRNCSKAYLVFGVEDKINPKTNSRKIIGTNYRLKKEEIDSLKREVYVALDNKITFKKILEEKVGGKRVLIFVIPSAPIGQPITYKKIAYQRVGEELQVIDMNRLQEIIKQKMDWTEEIIEEATIEDLDKKAIRLARKKFGEVHNRMSKDKINSWTDKEFLNHAHITNNGQITRTAILLLGKDISTHYLPKGMYEICWQLLSEKDEKLAHEFYKPPFLLTVDKLVHSIRNYTVRYYNPTSIFPIDVYKYDTEVIRELLNNCIAHQDYFLQSRINMLEKPKELVFANLGNFLPKTIEQVIEGKRTFKYRNPFLVEAMRNIGMIETIGYGIQTIFKKQFERKIAFPVYKFLEDGTEVEVILKGEVLNEKIIDILFKNTKLNFKDAFLLTKVQEGKSITPEQRRHLKDLNLIEGKGRYLRLSRGISNKIGQSAEYTKKKGLRDKACEQLILQHIEDMGRITRKEALELLENSLSNQLNKKQKVHKIKVLFRRLKKQNVIENKGGISSASYWVKKS